MPGFALNAFNVRDAFINLIFLFVKKTLDNQVCIVNCQVCEYLYSYATVYVFSCSCFPDAALSTEKRPNAKKEHCRGQICIVYRFFSPYSLKSYQNMISYVTTVAVSRLDQITASAIKVFGST